MKQEFSIFIVNPVTGDFETPESWANVVDPTGAELIALKRHGEQGGLFISKNLIKDGLGVLKVDFDGAVKLASGFKPITVYPADRTVEGAFRLPTRRECLDMYDARFQGLDDALKLIGGDPLTGCWIWTGDEDPDPEYNSNGAFIFTGDYGNGSNDTKYTSYGVRPVSAFLPF